MTSTVWTGWLILVALLAKGQMTPRAKCECDECKANEKAEAERQAQGLIERYLPCCRRKKPARNGDVEGQPQVHYLADRANSDQSGSSMKKE